jgi:hypothetical protein
VNLQQKKNRPWRHPDGSICQVYPTIAGFSLLLFLFSTAKDGAVYALFLFMAPGLLIAHMAKRLEWKTRELNCSYSLLLEFASKDCLRSIPLQEGYQCHCQVCRARDICARLNPTA